MNWWVFTSKWIPEQETSRWRCFWEGCSGDILLHCRAESLASTRQWRRNCLTGVSLSSMRSKDNSPCMSGVKLLCSSAWFYFYNPSLIANTSLFKTPRPTITKYREKWNMVTCFAQQLQLTEVFHVPSWGKLLPLLPRMMICRSSSFTCVRNHPSAVKACVKTDPTLLWTSIKIQATGRAGK